MSFNLLVGGSIAAVASTGAVVTMGLFGDEIGTTDSFKKLDQRVLATGPTTVYGPTVGPVTMTIVKTITLWNSSASAVTIDIFTDGTAAANHTTSVKVPANGTAIWENSGWVVQDANGAVITTAAPITATGDATGVQSGSTLPLALATVNGNVGTFGSATQVAQPTFNAKGLATACAAVAIQIAESQVTGLVSDLAAKQSLGNYLTALTGDGTASGPGSAAFTLTTVNGSPGTFGDANHVGALTVNAKGLVTATTLATIQPMQGWIDVTLTAVPVLTGNTAAANVTAINAILAAAPAGSTIYFPGGTYNFNAAWTTPAKQFVFQGMGGGLTGGYTILAWTSNVGGDLIALQNLIWYTQFRDLCFVSSGVAQTAGAVVNINGNAFTSFQNCTFGAIGGGFLFNLLSGPANNASLPLSDNSWNQSVISNCVGTNYKGVAIFVNARGSSLVVENSTFNGQWGTTSQCATAGIEGRWVGACQINSCDFIGHVNNMLLDPVTANSEVCASVQVSNVYFDFSLGSCIKIAGTGATVRCKWDTCTFTTSNASTGFSAVELAGSFVYAAGAQDLAFVNCNIYNTFGTTGATNGVLMTNAADVSFTNCKVAGWNAGYNVTPMASNKTNLQVIGGTVGPSGGFGLNTTGFLIAAGAYKGLQIRGVNAIGNTANLNLGAVTVNAGEASLFAITENAGINPKGSVTTPAIPASTVAVTNTTGFRITAYLKAGTITVVNINAVVSGQAAGAGASLTFPIMLDPGGSVAITYSVAPTWVWIAN